MYQLRIIYALLALLNTGDSDLVEHVREPLERMLKASLRMTHPDGRIALLGDSAFSIYNEPAELWNWWNRIEGDSALESPTDAGIFALPEAGYYGGSHPSGNYLICDAGPFGPSYQPGHAHGDLFSFELSLRGYRVICDAGVFGYEADALRRYCRSTRAHNTIEIEGMDQGEFWSVFRVGRRASPLDVHWEPQSDGFRLSSWHDGYERLPGKPRHHRQFHWHQRGALQIIDSVTSAKSVRVASRLHLHPSCEITALDEQTVQVQTPGGAIYVAFSGRGRLEVEASIYCPQFGIQRENRALVFSAEGVDLKLGYSISRESLDEALTLAADRG
jgi:uncharacterized heparinase superfamily protein